MLLSIGLMVKNEEKYLDKCLSSLQPILKTLDSELIIVDTGSTDKTTDISKKYTNNLYFHKWNNNFSEMRNIVINYCTGDWFFCIDGDEVLENYDDIITFFTSKTYQNYNTATIEIKNLNDSTNENKFVMATSPRLFKRDKDLKYIGSVHNQPMFKKPIMTLTSVCTHYGYIQNDKDIMEKKFLRTSELLKKELSLNPNNIYYLFQLSVTYGMHNEYTTALTYIKKAYSLTQQQKYKNSYLYVYQNLCSTYYFLNDYNNLRIYSEESLKIRKFIDFYFYLGVAEMELNEINNAIAAFSSYLDLYSNHDKSEKSLSIAYYSLSYIDKVYYFLYELYYKKNDYVSAKKYLSKVSTLDNRLVSKLIDLNFKLNEYDDLIEIEKQFLEDNDIEKLDNFYLSIEYNKQNLSDEIKENIEKLFSNGITNYNIFNKLRIEYRENKSIDLKKYKNYLSKLDLSKRQYYSDLIYYLIINKFDLSRILSNCTLNEIYNFLLLINSSYNNLDEILYEYLASIDINDKFLSVRVTKELCKFLVLSNNLDKTRLTEIYDLYINLNVIYMNNVYSNYIIQNERTTDVKNDEEGFWIFIIKALNNRENNERIFVRYLTKALEICPKLNSLVKYMLESNK